MKKMIIKITFLILFINITSNINAQYFDSVTISTIHLNKNAYEGDFYLDTNRHQYYIGLTTGEVARIADSSYINRILNRQLDTANGTVFGIWAEEVSGLNANAFEWSYGNGDESQAAFGIVLPYNCELFAIGLNVLNGNAEVEVYRNGIATGATSGVASASAVLNTLNAPIQFKAGDNINFRTLTTSGATSGGKAVAWFRVVNKIPTYKRYNGAGVPLNSIGVEDDEYLNTNNGDLYIKQSGVWVFKINLKGPPGGDTSEPIIQVTNVASGNINTGVVNFNWFNTSTATHITNSASDFTVASDGVTVHKSGIYKVTIYQYQIGTTSERNNAAVRVTVNNTVQTGFGAAAYQRRASGHDESTASLSRLVNLTSGDKVGIRNDQLANSGNVTCPAGSLIFMLEKK